jgi:hypothetical protein
MNYDTKGSHLIAARVWVDARLGPGTFADLSRDAPWRGILLPSGWYPVKPLVELLEKIGPKLGLTVVQMMTEISALNAKSDLTTIYRIFLRIAQPMRFLNQTPTLWSTYVRFGRARAKLNDPGHYIGEGSGLPEEFLDWASGAWLGFVPTAIELAGGRNARGQINGPWPEPGDGNTFRLECEVRYQ